MPGRVAARPPLPEKDIHAFVEFGNRLVGGVVITLTLVTWLAARRVPGLPAWARRVALLVFLGALAQAPIGYLAVATDLRWPVVMTHLLLSFALLAGAVVLTVEAFRAPRRALITARASRAAAARTCLRRRRARARRQRHLHDCSRPALGRRRAHRPLRIAGADRLRARRDRRRLPALVRDRVSRRTPPTFAAPLPLRPRRACAPLDPDGRRRAPVARGAPPWEIVLVHVVLAAAVWAGTVALAALFFRPPRSMVPVST